MSEPRSREFILNKARVYFSLHPDYWETWKAGNFDFCSLCKDGIWWSKTNLGCKKNAVLYCSRDLKNLYFGYRHCDCIEWIKNV